MKTEFTSQISQISITKSRVVTTGAWLLRIQRVLFGFQSEMQETLAWFFLSFKGIKLMLHHTCGVTVEQFKHCRALGFPPARWLIKYCNPR